MEITTMDRLRTTTMELFGGSEIIDESELLEEESDLVIGYHFTVIDGNSDVTKVGYDSMDDIGRKFAVWTLKDDNPEYPWWFLYEVVLEDGIGRVEFVTEGI